MTRLGQSPRNGMVKAQPAGQKGLDSTGRITIPAHMMRQIPENAWFKAEWHVDGILYRLAVIDDDPLSSDAPEWANGGPSA